MQLDTLVVELFMKNAEFLAQTKKVENALNGLKNVASGVGGAMALMFVKSGVKEFVEQASSLNRLSQTLRVNVEELQAFGEAVKREGGSVETFNSTVKKLSEEINAIPLNCGKSPLLGGLVRLGVNFRNLDGSMKNPLNTLKDLADRFQRLGGVRSLAIGKKLGLDEATIRLLQKGRKGLDELLGKYKDLGVISQKDIEIGDRLNRVFLDYRQIITFLGMRIAGYFLPIAEKFSKWFITSAKWVKNNERVFKSFLLVVGGLITSKLLTPLLALVSNPVVAGILAIGAALSLIIEDFLAWREGAESAFAPLYDWLSKKIPEAINIVKDYFNNIDENLPDLFVALEQIKVWGKDIKALFNDVSKSLDTSEFETLNVIMRSLCDLAELFFKSVYNGMELIGKGMAWLGFDNSYKSSHEAQANYLKGLTEAQKQALISKATGLDIANSLPIQQMQGIYNTAPFIASGQTRNNYSNNTDNSKSWRVDNISVTNNFSTPVPKNMQQGVANSFNSGVLQADSWIE